MRSNLNTVASSIAVNFFQLALNETYILHFSVYWTILSPQINNKSGGVVHGRRRSGVCACRWGVCSHSSQSSIALHNGRHAATCQPHCYMLARHPQQSPLLCSHPPLLPLEHSLSQESLMGLLGPKRKEGGFLEWIQDLNRLLSKKYTYSKYRRYINILSLDCFNETKNMVTPIFRILVGTQESKSRDTKEVEPWISLGQLKLKMLDAWKKHTQVLKIRSHC